MTTRHLKDTIWYEGIFIPNLTWEDWHPLDYMNDQDLFKCTDDKCRDLESNYNHNRKKKLEPES